MFLTAVMSAVSLFAQAPVNDDCTGAIDLGTAPACPPTVFSNVGATASNIGMENVPGCFSGPALHDVWFTFTCPDTLFDFRLRLNRVLPNGLQNLELAVYRGDCITDGLAEYLCKKSNPGDSTLVLDMVGLTPGATYFIRISDFIANGQGSQGNFNLCVDKIPPINYINEQGSTLCDGELYDSGGPNGDYGPNENHTFVICPSGNPACISLNLEYYNIEDLSFNPVTGQQKIGDFLNFFDGNTVNAPIIAQIHSGDFPEIKPGGGGGVALQLFASSGCITVQFLSDTSVNFEGWKAIWHCSNAACPKPDLITLDTSILTSDIVDAVKTPATTVTVTNVDCPTGAYGTFKYPSDQNDLGLQTGLVLTSGQALNVLGPNNVTGGIFFDNDGLGDPDLDYLSNDPNQESNDACVIELDVFAATDELSFEYVFGSEEYPEFVNDFNDIFAFFVSGPGIVGDPNLTNNAKNIALIPGTNNPVEINSVNNLLNWEYYRSNELGEALQYDGLTSDKLGIKKPLTARTSVIPCNTYHLKLAVADRGDFIYDSGVFVSEIQGGTPNLNVQFASGIDYFIESCSGVDDQLKISLNQPIDKTLSFQVSIGGTATLGVDYLLNMPNVVTFVPGNTQLLFPIVPIADNLNEGTETITITLSNNFGCGTVIYKVLTVELKDDAEVQVVGGDTLIVCSGATYQLLAKGAVNFEWAPADSVSNPFISNPTIKPKVDQWLQVTGTIGACSDVDSVFIHISDPKINVVALADTNICVGASVPLQAINNNNGQGISWTPNVGLSSNSGEFVTAKPSQTTTYTATLTKEGCSVKDAVTIQVDTLFFPALNFLDTTVCQNYPVKLANDIMGSTKYVWSPNIGLSNNQVSGPIATPNVSKLYTLTATSANGYCSQTATVNVKIIPADVDIAGPAYREICLGDTITLTANSGPSGSNVIWSPSYYLTPAIGKTVKAFPDESTTIVATYNINNCVVYDSVRIRVDSLPYSKISRVPDKTIYCPGDTVILVSKTYEPANFPDIDLHWLPANGQLTPDSLWNMVISAVVTDTFIRETVNHACSIKDTAIVPVEIPPMFMFTVTPPSICPGESAQINLTVTPPGIQIEWTADPTLSCTDCFNPTASPVNTTSYQVKAKNVACPAGSSVTVPVRPTAIIDLAPSQTICFGKSITLNDAPGQAGVTYSWTADPPGQALVGAQPIVTPGVTTTYSLVASGAQYCTAQAQTVITVAPQTFVSASFTPDHICPGEAVQLKVDVLPAGTSVAWAGPNLSCINCLSPSATPSDTAIYTVTTPGNVCPSESSITVPVWPVPFVDVAPTVAICLGDSILLNNAPAENGVLYVWTATPGGLVSNNAQIKVGPSQNTTYVLNASGVNYCNLERTVALTVANAAVNAGNDVQICPGLATTLQASVTGTQGGSFTWLPGNLSGNSVTVTPVQEGTYTVLYQYGPGNTCISTDSVKVKLSAPVEILSLTGNPQEPGPICVGSKVKLTALVNPANAKLVWSQNGANVDSLLNRDSVLIVALGESATSFRVIASNTAGCADTASIRYDLKRCFEMPNVFTPNGDELNSTFGPLFFGADTRVLEFKIYDRWGEKVYEWTPNKTRWDGKIDGQEAAVDVYVYYIRIQYSNGEEAQKKGQVTLLR